MKIDSKSLLLMAAISTVPAFASNRIKADETIIFFPTCGVESDTAKTWIAPIHGWIFEPEDDSIMRAGLLKLFKTLFGDDWTEEESRIFQQRAHLFLTDSERGKSLRVFAAGESALLGPTGPDGRLFGEFKFSTNDAKPALTSNGGSDRWLSYKAQLPEGDSRLFQGFVQILPETGISVISDLDDTIKDSRVIDRKELLANTFLRPFRPVEGMPELFRYWATKGAAFHYASASPRQLYYPIAAFLKNERFPMGSLDLRIFRPHADLSNMFSPSADVKKSAIEALLEKFPRRSFILVGDSGEGDPELYGEIARKCPNQIIRIFIRDVLGEGPDSQRFQDAFSNISMNKWTIFTDPEKLKNAPPF